MDEITELADPVRRPIVDEQTRVMYEAWLSDWADLARDGSAHVDLAIEVLNEGRAS
jgi:hypothetical protein